MVFIGVPDLHLTSCVTGNLRTVCSNSKSGWNFKQKFLLKWNNMVRKLWLIFKINSKILNLPLWCQNCEQIA